ncbi:V-type proton ATPase 16 kDa proteolipid subunit [Pseudocercospora fuligena]|uniref:V-type proton ATPase proteolipid subunit n=1 Tax=Pseudocercospora fuligena TaxID=685502 RepID=A0A8H6R9Z1_9PEZI|nr:V-type proton ATPase 16 kDa proteolipid subunit [Pseudocercospora fuligena]
METDLCLRSKPTIHLPSRTLTFNSQPFFSSMGVVAAIVFSSFGAAYGTAKSSIGCMSAGVIHPDLGVRTILPTVFSGILAIYGLVCSVLIANKITTVLPLYTSLINLGSGLAVGLCSLAAGFTIGIAGDAGVRSIAQQPRLFVSMVLILIFAEVLGLYGMIVALILDTRAGLGSKLCNPS